MKRLPPELYPVLAAAFLAPIIGGQVSLDANALQTGYWQGALGGPELPLAARAILGTLVAIGLGIALVSALRGRPKPRWPGVVFRDVTSAFEPVRFWITWRAGRTLFPWEDRVVRALTSK